jgi:putative ABC transport system permease protein
MAVEDKGGLSRRGWWERLGVWLLGDDADWVLGDLEERHRKRRGLRRWVSLPFDVASLAGWAISSGRVRRRTGMDTRMWGDGVAALIDTLRQDCRFTVNALRRDVGFTVVVILTLAIGIGANTAVFSVVHSLLLRPLPYPDPDRLTMIWTTIPGRGVDEVTSAYGNVRDWRAQTRAFEGLATFDPTSRTLTGGEWPEQIMSADVSANFFSVMGVEPLIGRTFSPEEARRRALLVVVSHEFWQARFGGSPTVIGTSIQLNEVPFEIVGVMPEGFAFPERDIWLPETLRPGWDALEARRGTDSWRVIGRLAPDQSLEAARTEMSAIASRLEHAHPAENGGLGIRVVPLHDQVIGASLRLALWALFGAVGLVLLVACANAAHVILARGLRRTREYAIRVALGATTARLVRLALTESLLISLAAGGVGVLVAATALDVLSYLAPANMPRGDEIAMGAGVLVYALGVSTVTAIAFGAGPVLKWVRSAPGDGLRQGASGASRNAQGARRVLVVAQLALAIVLLFGANLLGRSLVQASTVELGFQTEGVLIAQLRVADPEDRIAFYGRVLEGVRGLPGVQAAGLLEEVFITGAPNRAITVEGREGDPSRQDVRVDAVVGEVFETLSVEWIEGRDFSPSDGTESAPVGIINETLARRLWPGQSAVGERFLTGGSRPTAPWIEVVGVVGDMRRQGFESPPLAQVFRPYSQAPSGGMNLLVRTAEPPGDVGAAIRTRIAEVDRAVPAYVTPVEDHLGRYLAPRRSQTLLLGLFSAIALVLAAIGIYGVVQYSVAQRTRELGLRIALGARGERVARMVVGEGLFLALIGLPVGIGLGLWLSRVARGLLFGVAPTDLVSMSVTAGVLLVTTLLACWLPARRAARIDPVVALREA